MTRRQRPPLWFLNKDWRDLARDERTLARLRKELQRDDPTALARLDLEAEVRQRLWNLEISHRMGRDAVFHVLKLASERTYTSTDQAIVDAQIDTTLRKVRAYLDQADQADWLQANHDIAQLAAEALIVVMSRAKPIPR